MTHLSLDNLSLVSPYGGAPMQQQPTVQIQAPSPGPGYVQSWDPAQGKYVWMKCPTIPSQPRMGRWSTDVPAIRLWYDAVFSAERSAFQGWQMCPAYTQINPAKLAVDQAVKRAHPAAQIPRFMPIIWSMVLPGQYDMISGAALGRAGTAPGLVPGQWGGAATQAPVSRPNAAMVAARLDALDDAVRAITVSALRHWPTYVEGLAEWVLDPSVTPAEIRQRGQHLAALVRASESVPWPHKFFGTFLRRPRVELPAFASGLQYRDPMLAASGYLPRPLRAIQADIANYIVQNDGLLGAHFQAEFVAWIKEMEEELERKQEKAQRIDIIVAVVFGILSLGAGVAVTATLTIVQLGIGTLNARSLGAATREVIQKIMDALGITNRQMETFREWLAANARAMPPQDAPPGPPALEAQTPYSVFVEDTFVMAGSDIDELVGKGWDASSAGDRILIKDNATGDVVSVILHTNKEQALLVPREEIGAAMALPKGAAGSVGEEGFSPWLLAIPAGILLVA